MIKQKTRQSSYNTYKSICTYQGFTLIEAMIALVVLLLGMLGVIGMQYFSISGNTSSREIRAATTLAQEALDQSRAIPYADVQSSYSTPYTVKELSLNAGELSYRLRSWVIADCLDINTTIEENPCSDAVVASCVLDPDDENGDIVKTALSAVRSRACWQDRWQNYHQVTIDSVRWNEEVKVAITY